MGVPQGAVLSPLLFNIYTSRLLKIIQPDVSIAAYTDDIALNSSNSNPYTAVWKIERSFTYLTDNVTRYIISINPDKADSIIFSYHSKFKRPPHFRLGHQMIPFSNLIKYLGITLDRPFLNI